MEFSKAEKVEITEEQAKKYFEKTNQNQGEIVDKELSNVAGGLMEYLSDGRCIVSRLQSCGKFCKYPEPQVRSAPFCQNCMYAKPIADPNMYELDLFCTKNMK